MCTLKLPLDSALCFALEMCVSWMGTSLLVLRSPHVCVCIMEFSV
jgi:hypothetical protein